jgi:hypothetical protein
LGRRRKEERKEEKIEEKWKKRGLSKLKFQQKRKRRKVTKNEKENYFSKIKKYICIYIKTWVYIYIPNFFLVQ